MTDGDMKNQTEADTEMVVTYQPSRLDREKLGIIVGKHSATAGEIPSGEPAGHQTCLCDAYGEQVDENEPVYIVRKCVLDEGSMTNTGEEIPVPACEIDTDSDLSIQNIASQADTDDQLAVRKCE
jgi:hypothetical protein